MITAVEILEENFDMDETCQELLVNYNLDSACELLVERYDEGDNYHV